MTDEDYMKQALALARRGKGWTSPNPMVGAVIVRDGKVMGTGYHRRFGEAHAEVNAINAAGGGAEGATLYVTLEPCSHHGKTPPCVDRVLDAKVSRVVVGCVDPNPLVAGTGIGRLRDHGIAVDVGILAPQCEALNEPFFTFMKTGLPFVTVKYAQTIDGRIATSTGHSRWVSSDASLRFAHRLRGNHDAVIVGIGTVTADNPDLRVRLVRGRNPLRVVLDPDLRISQDARILDNQDAARTLMVAGTPCGAGGASVLKERGIETLYVERNAGGSLDLRALLAEMGKRQISSILVEGGGRVITSFVRERLFDRMIVITAPKIVGCGIEAVGDLEIERMDESIALRFERIFRKGDDIIMYLRKSLTGRRGKGER